MEQLLEGQLSPSCLCLGVKAERRRSARQGSPAGQERGCLLSVAGAAGQGRQGAPSLLGRSPAPGSRALLRPHRATPSGGRPSVGLGEPAGFSLPESTPPPPCRPPGLGGAHGSCLEIEVAAFQVTALFRSDPKGATAVAFASLGHPVESLTLELVPFRSPVSSTNLPRSFRSTAHSPSSFLSSLLPNMCKLG